MIDSIIKNIFKHTYHKSTNFGIVNNYKYYPKYLGNNHYTLVIFRTHDHLYYSDVLGDKSPTEYRLYIHKNEDDSFVKIIFQLSDGSGKNKYNLNTEIKKIFKHELLLLKLKNIKNKIETNYNEMELN